MSQINFLPETFQRAHRRQQRRPAEFMVILGTLVALAGLWLYQTGPDHAMADQASEIDQQIEAIAQQRAEQDRLFQERSDLQRKLLTARETYQPVSVTQVLSRLSALTPEPIRLVNLELVAQRPTPESKPQPTAKKKVVGDKAAAAPAEPNLMKIAIIGHAPSDEELVTLIRGLTADPVFTSVALRNSKMNKTKTHYVREFHLDVVIDLDRRFIAESKDGGETNED